MNTVESKIISDTIDQALRAEKAVRDMTRQKQRKILVLGQSESGKSTLIKQFRLLHSAETFSAERQSWKSIVYLNIIRSIWKVIEILSSRFNLTNPTDVESQNFARLRLRLMPLRSVELSIVKSLSSPREVAQTWSNGPNNGRGSPGIGMNKEYEYEDVVVHPDSIWQRLRQRCSYNTSTSKAGTSLTIEHEEVRETDDPSRTLEVCATDMKKLWSCPVARQCLKQTGLFIEEISGFFLNDIERITSPGYIPTDDDILRTRVKTIRPTETILTCRESGVEWKIYDVGGARRQRAKWAPFFDDVDSLVVMAPVSAFDQVLSEDPSVNRLKDSFDMWRELCNTTILHKIPVLLFLNKIDLLEKKLHEGVKLSKYLVSYGDRPNDFKSVLQFLHARFLRLRTESKAPNLAPCYVHHTSLVDRATTQTIVAHVRDKIAMEYLENSYMV
ncbi:guanine nucleotide-binding protein alpha-4 subunit [Rhizoctonia solani AG-3 Rhs1AP]|uniref:Guanine nucleotide-binding protein alpha-4 subunit n=1 Tax=Rhizoctonia solani AG-3 Rhs1AP TaxID=1086054 RepID=A0A0A1UII9_9AGAM|nr:guanine nucleotide-binding protein alpha-4 subunit [Rhizoctonia solani AG-3 Rhs1AP]